MLNISFTSFNFKVTTKKKVLTANSLRIKYELPVPSPEISVRALTLQLLYFKFELDGDVTINHLGRSAHVPGPIIHGGRSLAQGHHAIGTTVWW